MASQPKKIPTLVFYLPLIVALPPALLLGEIAVSIAGRECEYAGRINCETYHEEYHLFCAVILAAILVSFFVLQRIIVVTVSVPAIAWDIYVIYRTSQPFEEFSYLTVVAAVFVVIPIIVATGIAAKWCLDLTDNNFLRKR